MLYQRLSIINITIEVQYRIRIVQRATEASSWVSFLDIEIQTGMLGATEKINTR